MASLPQDSHSWKWLLLNFNKLESQWYFTLQTWMGSSISFGYLVSSREPDEEYGIMFKFHILVLVFLSHEAVVPPGLHMPRPKNRRKEQCPGRKGNPSAQTLIASMCLQPILGSLGDVAQDSRLFPRMTEWGLMDNETFYSAKALDSHFVIKINSKDLTCLSQSEFLAFLFA